VTRVAVFGLGYVGSVSAACFAAAGHPVVGVDVSDEKVAALASGRPPVLEPGLPELIERAVAEGRLTATTDAAAAIAASDVSLICVGTPSAPNGSLGTIALERVVETIGDLLKDHPRRHTVVVRSTVVPGTTEELVRPILESRSALRAGDGFGLAMNPEFLREGSSVADFNDPARTVIGQFDDASGDIVESLYEGVPGARFRVPLRTAEMVKYVDNSFHALKVAFANEIGNFCNAIGVDSHEVMEIVKADRKLNVSPAYLTPGFAFGGSCLPKDLRALLHAARKNDLDLILLESVLASNERQVRQAVDLVLSSGARQVGIFGLAFKAGTDDLRESPMVELSERLLGKGRELKIYDPHIAMGRLIGSNRAYVDAHIPHLSALMVDTPEEVLNHAELCVVGAAHPETVRVLERSNGTPVLDLARLPDAPVRAGRKEYLSVSW
jgi:GDP-mannose 6-dehydrogenase